MELMKIADGKKDGVVSLSDAVFACEYKEPLVHQVVVAYQAGARAGTKAQKSRSDVSGGGIKPWRQKGTGRARAGTIRSPLWRTGGVTFAARPRDFSQKVNRKMYRSAMASILSELARQERLVAVDAVKLAAAKTRELAAWLKAGEFSGRVVIVTDEVDTDLFLASRNLPYVTVVTSLKVDPVSLVSADHVIVTVAALKQLEERLA